MKKNSFTVRVLFLIGTISLFMSCSAENLNKKSIAVNGTWKICQGDDADWSDPEYNDSSWEKRDNLAGIKFAGPDNYFWARAILSVPASLDKNDLWLGFKKFNAACDVYADGIYIGTRGCMPPNVNIKIEEEKEILIPSTCVEDGKVDIALRFYLPGNSLNNPDLHFDNGDMAYFQTYVKSIFNQRLFIMMAVASAFFIIYSILQYLVDSREITFIYFILNVLFVALYFIDLGSQTQMFSYNIQRSIFRCFLGIGMCFLLLFLNRFYNRKHYKPMLIICLLVSLLLFIVFMIFRGQDDVIETLFLVGLVVVVVGIIYGFICTISAIKRGNKDSIPILLGFIIGTAIAAHDIIYQIIGKIPFMWIQGIAFFVLDLSIFITIAIRQLKAKRRAEILADETEKQKETLKKLFEHAQILANESNSISQELNESVISVVDASKQTQTKVEDINKAIQEQNRIRQETDTAVRDLTDFLGNISQEFTTETEIISKTVSETQEVIKGIAQVGEGISTAASFTSSLMNLTNSSSEVTKQLMKVNEDIQKSSKEILGVVTTLDTFANKIDLLSMNASIEAAHSGVSGKGFSVIAHEIKSLASQTKQWSAKIGEIITSVIQSIEESVVLTEQVDNALSKINEGSIQSADKVNSAADGIRMQEIAGNSISKDSQILYQSANQMQQEVKEQGTFSDQVLGNMNDLMDASNSVNTASLEISRESERLNQEAEKLTNLAKRTTESAQKLLDIMNIQK